jgi:hypothetical protein
VNKVMEVILAVPDADLKMAMREMKVFRDTGVLSAGVVRRVAAALVSSAGVGDHEALKVARVELVEAAAFKWAGLALTS